MRCAVADTEMTDAKLALVMLADHAPVALIDAVPTQILGADTSPLELYTRGRFAATNTSAAVTKAVLAMVKSLSPGDAVGTNGSPEKLGEISGALSDNAASSAPLSDGSPVNSANEAAGCAVMAAATNAVVASCVVFVPGAAVGAVGTPINAGVSLVASVLVTACTYAVVASNVDESATGCVGAVGDPVKAGDANGAFRFNADCKSLWLLSVPVIVPHDVAGIAATAPVTKAVVAMLVSASPGVGVGAVGLPVKTGEASGASSKSAALRVDASVAMLVASASSASDTSAPATPDAFVTSSLSISMLCLWSARAASVETPTTAAERVTSSGGSFVTTPPIAPFKASSASVTDKPVTPDRLVTMSESSELFVSRQAVVTCQAYR